MMQDPSPQRVSACPVHFIWDGRGHGRTWVRLGFLGFVGAGGLASAGTWLRIDLLTSLSWTMVVGAGAMWGLGQILSARAASRGPQARSGT